MEGPQHREEVSLDLDVPGHEGPRQAQVAGRPEEAPEGIGRPDENDSRGPRFRTERAAIPEAERDRDAGGEQQGEKGGDGVRRRPMAVVVVRWRRRGRAGERAWCGRLVGTGRREEIIGEQGVPPSVTGGSAVLSPKESVLRPSPAS